MKKTIMEKVFEVIADDNERFGRLQSGEGLSSKTRHTKGDVQERKAQKNAVQERPKKNLNRDFMLDAKA